MQTRSQLRLSVTIFIAALLLLFSDLVSLLISITANNLPRFLTPYLHYAWIPLVVIVVLTFALVVWQTRREALISPTTSASQQPTLPPSSTTPRTTISSASPVTHIGDYHSCVLSYATQDEAFATKLHTDLQQRGISCWFAPHDLKTGDKLRNAIYEAVQKQDKLLIVLSEHAIESAWVEEEVDVALEREHQPPKPLLLFPIRLDDHVFQTRKAWATAVRQRFIGDFRQWKDEIVYQQALQRLLRDLRA